MKAYRIEEPIHAHGMWHTEKAEVNPDLKLIKCPAKDMPMPESEVYGFGGKRWYSATDTPEKLAAWFTAEDVAEVEGLGYYVYEFDLTDCRVLNEYELVFTREMINSMVKFDPTAIWGEAYTKAKQALGE